MSISGRIGILTLIFLWMNTGNCENLTNAEKEIFIPDDEEHTWTSNNYPNPYPDQNEIMILKADFGYSIAITIDELELDSANGDFLLIKPGITLNDQNKGAVFTYTLKTKRKLVIDQENAYIALKVLGKNSGLKKGVSLVFKRIGEKQTTTEPTTTPIPWPTPGANDRIYFTGNVSGRNEDDFKDILILNEFKNALVMMASEYCSIKNILLSRDITIENIHISYLTRCPSDWPNSHMCIQVKFSIPVFLQNSSLNEYQLSSYNLEEMWNTLSGKWLNTVNLAPYEEPDSKSNMLMWFLISCIILVLFAIGLIFILYCNKRMSPFKKQKRDSDTRGIIENEVLPKPMSLNPHPLQIIPPFFDRDDTFDQYEPKINDLTPDSDTFSEDSDEEIIVTNFNHNHNHVPDKKRPEESNS